MMILCKVRSCLVEIDEACLLSLELKFGVSF